MASHATAAKGRPDATSEDETSLSDLLFRVSRALMRETRCALEPLGLTPGEGRAIVTLARAGEPLRMADLAQRLGVVPRSATTIVDALEAEGLLERKPDVSDRRAIRIDLTDTGRARAKSIRQLKREAADQRLSSLSPEDRAQLECILTELDSGPRCCAS